MWFSASYMVGTYWVEHVHCTWFFLCCFSLLHLCCIIWEQGHLFHCGIHYIYPWKQKTISFMMFLGFCRVVALEKKMELLNLKWRQIPVSNFLRIDNIDENMWRVEVHHDMSIWKQKFEFKYILLICTVAVFCSSFSLWNHVYAYILLGWLLMFFSVDS